MLNIRTELLKSCFFIHIILRKDIFNVIYALDIMIIIGNVLIEQSSHPE